MKKIFILFSLVLVGVLTSCQMLSTSQSTSSSTTTTTTKSTTTTTTTTTQTTTTTKETVKKAKNILNYLDDEGNVPLIEITTKNNEFPKDKENYVSGELAIKNQSNGDWILDKQAMGIRLRGNSTSAAPKKPFRIKFDKKVSLFGLPEAKSWVLLANYFDKTGIRNYLAYLTANKLDNLYFQPSSILVDVTFNGEYLGNYLLCEQMQTGKGRVDIENKNWNIKENPTFFLELDALERIKEDGLTYGVSYFQSNEIYYAIKYPESPVLTSIECNYIAKVFDAIFMAIKSKNGYERFMDVDSFIDYYIVNELFKNVDCHNSSVYYFYENGVLKAGPVWDFDIGLGVVGQGHEDGSYANYESSELWVGTVNKLYKLLFEDPVFLNKVKERYAEVKPILLEIYDEMAIIEQYLTDDLQKNINKWPIPGDTNSWLASRYDRDYLKLKTFDDHMSYLKDKLDRQFEIMDKYYA